MTASTIRARARHLLNDEDSGAYRYETDTLDDYIDDALALTYQLRPDAFLTSSGIGQAPGSLATLGDEWLGPFAAYVAFKALSEDNADTTNAAAADAFLKQYMGQAIGNSA